ncbi:hypothetical protein C7M41_02029 (plasmid) [Pediococcus acidilactici]|nr:hypothetical protein C7M41_02029 [Pediococcus acidilactici]QHM55299.1 hypothetical protein C7M42_02063 [Pediococcus acidilactici]
MQPFTHHYSSDISREQFELIRPGLEGARKCTKPRKIDLYDVFCAILYTLKNGCTWRDLPLIFLNGKPFTITCWPGKNLPALMN